MRTLGLCMLMIGCGYGTGWFLLGHPESEIVEPTRIVDANTSVLGDLVVRSPEQEGSLPTNVLTMVRNTLQCSGTTELLLALDHLRLLNSDQLAHVIDEILTLPDEDSLTASLLLAGTTAILAEKAPQALFDQLRRHDASITEGFHSLLFEKWMPPNFNTLFETEDETSLSDSILVGMAKRDQDAAWCLILKQDTADPDVWRTLTQQWHGRGLDFLKARLAELSSEWNQGRLLEGWGLQLMRQSPQEAIELIDQFEITEATRSSYLSTILRQVSRRDLPLALDYLANLQGENASNDKQKFATMIASSNPNLTTSWALEHLEGDELSIFLEHTLPILAQFDRDRAVSLLPKIQSPLRWSEAMLGIRHAVTQKDPVAAYEIWKSQATPQAPDQDLVKKSSIKSMANAVARVDLDYAYQTLTTESSFKSEREWANAITYQLDRMSREESERWLASLPDAEWRRRLRWILEEQQNAPW